MTDESILVNGIGIQKTKGNHCSLTMLNKVMAFSPRQTLDQPESANGPREETQTKLATWNINN